MNKETTTVLLKQAREISIMTDQLCDIVAKLDEMAMDMLRLIEQGKEENARNAK